MRFPRSLPPIVVLLAASVAVSQTPPASSSPAKPPEKRAEGKAGDAEGGAKPKAAETRHEMTLGGEKLAYAARAATMPLVDREGKTTAHIFYISYAKEGITDPAARPVTFSFNGGPGSSSVWMHLGLLGPKRVRLQENGFGVPPPYELVDNEFSLLDETDLVFIDPVGTGYSRAEKPADGKNFWGVSEDAQSVAEFIRLYVTRNTRWASPKFLIGESYGTTRAAALSGELQRAHRMNLNGIMLVSTVLDFQTIRFGGGNDLPYVLFLPSYTATAWHHRKLAPDLQKLALEAVLRQAEAFALGEYSQALLRGAALDPARRAAVARQLARFTGLSEAFIDRANLRVSMSRFGAELLRDQNLNIGRFDSRFTSFVRDPLSSSAERDPSADAISSAFASTFNHYVRAVLKYEDDRPYQITSSEIGKWNWGDTNSYLNVADTLAESMTANPFMKVHVSCGIFDLATPYLAARHTFQHLNVHPSLVKNVVLDDYAAGHMMYLNLPDLRKQKADLAKFIRAARGR